MDIFGVVIEKTKRMLPDSVVQKGVAARQIQQLLPESVPLVPEVLELGQRRCLVVHSYTPGGNTR